MQFQSCFSSSGLIGSEKNGLSFFYGSPKFTACGFYLLYIHSHVMPYYVAQGDGGGSDFEARKVSVSGVPTGIGCRWPQRKVSKERARGR
jgi:hypothetical protein